MSIINLTLNLSGIAALATMAVVPAANSSLVAPASATAVSAMPNAPAAFPLDDPAREAKHISRAEDGLFYVWCEVNGTRIRFLVDTGASVTVLTRSDARRAGVAIGPQRAATRMRTASGSTGMHWVRLDSVRVAGNEVHDLDAAVMTAGPAVSLLGQNMLTKMASVAIDGNQLHLR